MVRAAALGALLLIAGCGQEPRESTHELADIANTNARTALMRIETLEAKNAELEKRLAANEELRDAYKASLDEARENHTALLKTFNDNVGRGNKRDTRQEAAIGWLQDHAVLK